MRIENYVTMNLFALQTSARSLACRGVAGRKRPRKKKAREQKAVELVQAWILGVQPQLRLPRTFQQKDERSK